MKNLKFISVVIFIALCWNGIIVAQERAESFDLNEIVTGQKDYIARDYIRFKPGFAFKAANGQSLTAKIDDLLVFTPSENTYLNTKGTTSDTNSAGASIVGTIPGSFNVTSSGAATYTIPIVCPPGINGMQPNIAISYNSQSGIGIAGYKVGLSGISSITRTAHNPYYHGDYHAISFDGNDRFVLDGQPLILTSGTNQSTYGNAGTTYGTEVEDYGTITAHGKYGDGPSHFIIEQKDGTKMEYGASPKSKMILSDKKGVLTWYLGKVEDKNGNFIEYIYGNNNDEETWIKEVKYTGNSKTNWNPEYTLAFNYDDIESKPVFVKGNSINKTKLLNNIGLLHKGNLLKTYKLTYDAEELAGKDKFLPKLTSVKLINKNDEAVSSSKFTWENQFEGAEILPKIPDGEVYFTGNFLGNGKKQLAIGSYSKIRIFELQNNLWIQNKEIIISNPGGLDGYRRAKVVDFNSDGFDDVLYTNRWDTGPPVGVGGDSFNLIDVKNNKMTPFEYLTHYEYFKNYTISGHFLPNDEMQIISLNTTNDNFVWNINSNSKINFNDNLNLGSNEILDVLSGDLNGDGMDELIIHMTNKLVYYKLEDNTLVKISEQDYSGNKIEIADINNDGTDDIYDKENLKIKYVSNFQLYNSNISLSKKMLNFPANTWQWSNDKRNVKTLTSSFLMDINADGYTDIVKLGSYGFEATLTPQNVGNFGYGEEQLFHNAVQSLSDRLNSNDKWGANLEYIKPTAPGPYPNEENWGKYEVTFASYFGKEVYINNKGKSFKPSGDSYIFNKEQLSRDAEIIIGDFRGDGLSDFFIKDSDGEVLTATRGFYSPNNFIGKINTGFEGANYQITHRTLLDGAPHYAKGTNPISTDIINVAGSNMVTTQVITPSGLKYKYEYEGAKVHTKGKGFLGFTKRTTKMYESETASNPYAISVSTSQLNDTYDLLLPYLSERYIGKYGGNDILREKSLQNFSVVQDDVPGYLNRRINIKPSSQVYNNYQTGARIETTYNSFDAFGNATDITTDNSGMSTTTKTIDYPASGWWRKTKPDIITTTTQKGSESHTETIDYDYYDTDKDLGRLKEETLNGDLKTTYSNYDAYGNVGKVAVEAKTRDNNNQIIHTDTRTKSYTYTDDHRFVQTETDEEAAQTVSYEYYLNWGILKKTATELGTTTQLIDAFGRPFETIDHNGIHASTSLQWNDGTGPSEAKYCAHTKTSGQSDLIRWYDKLGREIRTEYETNGKKTFVETQYTNKGQVWKVSEPYFSGTPKYTTYWYNLDGTIQESTAFNGDHTTYTYQKSGNAFLTTVSGPRGISLTKTNKLGQVVQNTDFGGATVDFEYYASGLQKEATATGSGPITLTYDKYGQRRSLDDPDARTVTSIISPLGLVLNETDNKGNTTVYGYKNSGLLENITRGNEVVAYKYDNFGRPESIEKKQGAQVIHSQIFEYSPDSPELLSKTETIDGKTFSLNFDYDNKFKRLVSKTYHDGFKVNYKYNLWGELNNITVPDKGFDKNVWLLEDINAKGQVTAYRQGSQSAPLTTILGYDSNGLPLHNMATYGGHTIFSYQYGFGPKYNLAFRIDHIKGQKEEFKYDDGNHQLTAWSLSDKNTDNSYTFKPGGGYNTYQPSGNIDKKKDPIFLGGNGTVHFNYGGNNGGPHALSSYLGDPIDKLDHTIDYNSFNKVRHMHLTQPNGSKGKQFDITYGVDELRRKTVFSDGNDNEQLTRYYFDDYEEEILPGNKIRKIHYINGGTGMAAIYITDETDVNKSGLYYTHTDYQGNLLALSSEKTVHVVERYAYDPWGNRRNPENWAEAANLEGKYQYTCRGYTLHEHLDGFGVINMNGRVFDPILSRFLSPDPFIQAPESPLNYNRYTYCLNNPLLYTDPSGYTWGIFKPFVKAWNWFWDTGEKFAEWADETPWFPSSGEFGVNVDHNANWGYRSEVAGQETFNSRTNYDYDWLANKAAMGMQSRMPGRSVGSASYDPYSIEVNWIMAGDENILNSIDGDLNVIPYSYYDNLIKADFAQRFSGRAEIVSPEFEILAGIGALRAFRTAGVAANGVNLSDDAFVHVTPSKYANNILKNGLDPAYSGGKSYVTRWGNVKNITNTSDFNTVLYRQNLWKSTAGKFDGGATILHINAKPTFFSPRTNWVNGVPQYIFTSPVSPKYITPITSF
ncbi:RHS repeat-associated core domain-containing protein [Saccharicrinis carchari]|uniref:RHS repeat-associated core domain-containing protein n=1 Tax=Saccharicrinis carchari TaxID=1168039 RepID=A0A521BIM0_SACCC|nr:RHS repeat-associated core domain-containing protein [Saccharicrinis carchari]SMO46741.1 RHS repeat-associated core domain-containing protein [Saccharicrinis carchari]